MLNSATRCCIIGLHLHPTFEPLIRYTIQLLKQNVNVVAAASSSRATTSESQQGRSNEKQRKTTEEEQEQGEELKEDKSRKKKRKTMPRMQKKDNRRSPIAKMTDELRVRQYALNPVDFELCYHYFRQMIHQRKHRDAFIFMLNYFMRQYFVEPEELSSGSDSNSSKEEKNPIIMLNKAKQYSLTKKRTRELNPMELQQFRTIAQQFVAVEEPIYAIHIWQLAIWLAPDQPSLYYSLYEIYNKLNMYLDAFKAFAMHIFCTSITRGEIGSDMDLTDSNAFSAALATSSTGSVEQYQKCGELLEKCEYYSHALLAYYQCHVMHVMQIEQDSMQMQEEGIDNFDSLEQTGKLAPHLSDALLDEYENREQLEQDNLRALHKKYHFLLYINNHVLPKLLEQQKQYRVILSDRANIIIQHILAHLAEIDDISAKLSSNPSSPKHIK